jgi:UDP-N-acetylglucosamine transferase subunit ALG13
MTTLLVATTGGHLAQLAELADRLPDAGSRLWVTHRHQQSESMLAGEEVVYVPYIGVRDVRGVVKSVPRAKALLRERGVRRVVSTGSGIALGYLPYLASRGVESHYIESAARVAGPSVSGRLLGTMPRIRRYTQYRHLARDRWRFGGSVFDGFEVVPHAAHGDELRVVVTVGTAAEFPFRRLIDSLVPLLGPGGRLEQATGKTVRTLWQTGATPLDGVDIDARPFLPADELASALANADVVLSHAGVGSALAALSSGRVPVVVPRAAAHGEAGDDHQGQVVAELAGRGLAIGREVGQLGVDDLLEAASRAVHRVASPPPFELAI